MTQNFMEELVSPHEQGTGSMTIFFLSPSMSIYIEHFRNLNFRGGMLKTI